MDTTQTIQIATTQYAEVLQRHGYKYDAEVVFQVLPHDVGTAYEMAIDAIYEK